MTKNFAQKFLIFALPVLAMFLFLEYQLSQIPTSYSRKRDHAEHFDQIETLIFGTSHAYYDFNPAFFERPGFNFANTSQSLVIDSQLIQRYILKSPKLKKIILNLSYFSFEYRLAGEVDDYREYFYPRIFGIVGDGGLWSLFDLRSLSLAATFGPEETRKIIQHGFSIDLSEGMNDVGWYDGSKNLQDRLPISEEAGASRAGFHTSIMQEKYKDANMAAIALIVSLARKQNVEVILTQAPANLTYSEHLDPDAEGRFRATVAELEKKYGLRFFDYLRDSRFSETDFIDNDHLNADGAARFSRIFDEEVLRSSLAQIRSQTPYQTHCQKQAAYSDSN